MRNSIVISMIALGATALAQETSISAARIREQTKYLSSDAMEGRGVGQKGGDLATEYIAHQFASVGAKPAGDNGSYFQKVSLVGVETQPESTLSATAGGKTINLKYADEWVGADESQRPNERFDGDVVFVGHGISAPEYKWDDYKGMDVSGKVLLMFTNEPPSNDPKFFEGRALTYYGRWTYKYEEGLRHGAKAVILMHTTPTAGYSWGVVRASWGRETPFMKLTAGQKALSFAGWVSTEAATRLLAMAGKNIDQLLAAADKPDFRPIALSMQIRGNMVSKLRPIESRNVAAIVPGSDPKLKDEAVIYSAHWDHFGVGEPVNGDKIYNGAIDNATGCAVLLEIARAWAALPRKPKRSALFLAVTAEEAGLKGSAYYATHPIVPAAKTALDLNYDALYPWGRAKDVVVTGAERTTVWPTVQAIAKRLTLTISPDAEPEQGHYFRSDHFSFAHAGIPAFSVEHATQFAGKPADFYPKAFEEYNSKHYHQPSDEFQESWDFTALQQAAEFGFLLGQDVANQANLPDWRPGDQFHR